MEEVYQQFISMQIADQVKLMSTLNEAEKGYITLRVHLGILEGNVQAYVSHPNKFHTEVMLPQYKEKIAGYKHQLAAMSQLQLGL